MEDQVKLTHYQKYKDTIIKNVKKFRTENPDKQKEYANNSKRRYKDALLKIQQMEELLLKNK